jgi:predicted metal-dependent hydrolase
MPHLPGSPPVEVTLRRSRAARRLSLRVSGLDGRVTLTIPARTRDAEAIAFLREREPWLRAALARVPAMAAIGPGSVIPVEGARLTVDVVPGRGAVRREGDALIVPGDPAEAGPRIAAFLQFLARDRLARACDLHAARAGRCYSKLVLRDVRSRWGSCSAAGVLMFSWRLVMAPPEVLDYVAAHEVAHLVRMDHSPAFWAEVERLCPGHSGARRWLRQNGSALHRYLFGGAGRD